MTAEKCFIVLRYGQPISSAELTAVCGETLSIIITVNAPQNPLKREEKNRRNLNRVDIYISVLYRHFCADLLEHGFFLQSINLFFHVFYEFFPCVSLIFFLFDDVLFGITNTFPFIIICLRFYIWSEEVFLYCLNITILWLR